MRALMLTCALAVLGAATSGCIAPEWLAAPEKKRKAKIDYTVNKKAWKHLDRAQKAMAEKKYDEAIEELDRMKERSRRFNEYELALMWQTYAHVYAEQEQMAQAAEALATALEGETLPEGALKDSMYNLGQLQLATEQYDKAADTFTRWLELADAQATTEARYVIGISLAQAKRFDDALVQAQRAVDEHKDPPENWLQLLMSIQFERKNMKAVEGILKRLIVRYPRKTYWLQLAGVYAERKSDAKALAVYELMYRQKDLESGDELTRLAQMLLFHGVPKKAVDVLTGGIGGGVLERDVKTLELLANGYLYAREVDDALGVLSEAAKKSDNGKLYVQLGRQHLRAGRWDAAAGALKRGIARGGLESPGQVYLLLGSVYFNAEDFAAAQGAFKRAMEFAYSRKTAQQWLSAVERQLAQNAP